MFIRFTSIPAYFEHAKLVETGEYKKIDERRFREVLEKLDVYNLGISIDAVRKAIITSRKLIRKYEVLETVDKLKTFISSNTDTLTVNGLILAVRENGKVRIRLPFRIFLAYHNMPYTVEEIEARPFK